MPITYEPPLANPAPYGLYSAAQLLEYTDPNRFGHEGIRVRSLNCGESGVWPIDYCADAPAEPKTAERPADPDIFTGGIVYGADDCGILASKAEAIDRANQILRLTERIRVEEHVAAVLIARSAAPVAAGGIVEAVGIAEEELGLYGFPGTIHAAAHLAARAAQANLIVRNGTTLTSPLGHKWAFGGGYDTLGNNIYITGPVVIHRGAVNLNEGLEVQRNGRLFVAEREFVVTWECLTVAIAAA